jgi:hypothetical protein
MAPFVVRRSERIDYRVPVTLFAARDNMPPVVGRSLDVSEGGMRVLAPIPMPVGAVVRCELTLDGRSTLLEGRVAWLSQAKSAALLDAEDEASQALGIGIRFETLTREESGVLRKLISQATEGYMPAELELHGVHDPVVARAVPTPSGARISAALPWLKRGAPVGVRFVGAPGDVRGHVSNASLRELPNGGRRLQIDVEAEAPARVRRDTQYGDALDFERARPLESGAIDVEGIETQPAAAVASAGPVIDAVRTFDGPRSKLPTWLALTVGAAIGAAATMLTMHQLNAEPRPIVRLTQSEANAALQAGSLSTAAATGTRVAGPASAAVANPLATAAAPAVAAATANVSAQVAAALPSEPADLVAASSAALPAVVSGHGVTTVRIPFRGSLHGMTSRIWAEPYALAIDLPRGSTSLALGRHVVSDPEGIVSLIRMQARGGSLLVRLGLRKPITTHSVALGGDLLELRVVASDSITAP